MIDNNTIQSAVDKKYTEFSDAIKQELVTKMANNPVAKDYASDYDKIQKMKDIFAQINSEE